jgi:hypothetical protein
VSALQLPGQLAHFLNVIGYKWPESDETKLFEMGQKWTKFGTDLNQVLDTAEKGASQVWSENQGKDIAKFADHWKHSDGPAKILHDAAKAAQIIGTGMCVISAIILALKTQMIVQLVQLMIQTLQAIAAAAATWGASLSWIPIYNQITSKLVGMIIDQVVQKLLNA